MRLASRLPRLRNRQPEPTLFDGDSALFMDLVSSAKTYGEYGMGLSTLYVANNANCPIYSVDSSSEWVTRIASQLPESGSREIVLRHVDLGPLGDWGTPLGYSHRHNIPQYLSGPWTSGSSPDLVLVDGRFRVACAAFSLAQAEPGTVVVVDDYADRPEYFVIEELVPIADRCGRQVTFVVPEELDRELATQMVIDFTHVRE